MVTIINPIEEIARAGNLISDPFFSSPSGTDLAIEAQHYSVKQLSD